MSIAPTRIMRMSASRLWGYAVLALRKDVPLPERLTALEVLQVNLDHLLSPPTIRKLWRNIMENIPYVIQYMRDKGYEISEPTPPNKEIEDLSDINFIVMWVRREFKKKESESVMDYVDRVAHLSARLLTVYSLVTGEVLV